MELPYSMSEMAAKAVQREKQIEEAIGSGNIAMIFTEPGMGAVTHCKKTLGPNVLELDLSAAEFGEAKQALAGAKTSKRPVVISGLRSDDDPESPSGKLHVLAVEAAKEISEGGVKVAVVIHTKVSEETARLSKALQGWRAARDNDPAAPAAKKPSAQ